MRTADLLEEARKILLAIEAADQDREHERAHGLCIRLAETAGELGRTQAIRAELLANLMRD